MFVPLSEKIEHSSYSKIAKSNLIMRAGLVKLYLSAAHLSDRVGGGGQQRRVVTHHQQRAIVLGEIAAFNLVNSRRNQYVPLHINGWNYFQT